MENGSGVYHQADEAIAREPLLKESGAELADARYPTCGGTQ
jgi:hypothetical protein